jgi:hypothetical protein
MEGVSLRDEVGSFVESMKNSRFVLAGCQKFVEDEQRDSTYMVTMSYRLNHGSQSDLILAIKSLLVSWNWQLIQRDVDLRHQLDKDVREAVMASNDLIQKFQTKRLETVDIGQIFDQVAETFRIFSSKHSIQNTGASKALHIINPDLFVMWDNRIRACYHRLHDDYRVKWSPVDECYAKFLTTCSYIARSLEPEQEELVKSHPSYTAYGFRKTLPKMIDECNFARFFLSNEWS